MDESLTRELAALEQRIGSLLRELESLRSRVMGRRAVTVPYKSAPPPERPGRYGYVTPPPAAHATTRGKRR